MRYVTLEVQIDNGKVTTKNQSQLPEKASGLLIILQPEVPEMTPLEALDALQKHIALDSSKAEAWMATVREARR